MTPDEHRWEGFFEDTVLEGLHPFNSQSARQGSHHFNADPLGSESALVRCAELAGRCLDFDPLARPSMEEIAHTLQMIYMGE